mgnify:CR=1 FL=1
MFCSRRLLLSKAVIATLRGDDYFLESLCFARLASFLRLDARALRTEHAAGDGSAHQPR